MVPPGKAFHTTARETVNQDKGLGKLGKQTTGQWLLARECTGVPRRPLLKVRSLLEGWQTSLGCGQGEPRPVLLWEGKCRQTPATGSTGEEEEPQQKQSGGTRELGNGLGRLERETDEVGCNSSLQT